MLLPLDGVIIADISDVAIQLSVYKVIFESLQIYQ